LLSVAALGSRLLIEVHEQMKAKPENSGVSPATQVSTPIYIGSRT
jgi:hypothetical protein